MTLDRGQYLRHVLTILSGNGAAQVVNLLGYPFLGRLYSPQEFGIFGMFLAAVAVPGTIASGRFEFAIPTAPRWGVSGVLWLCVAVSVAMGLLSAGIAMAFQWVSGDPGPASLLLLFGLCVTLTGLCTAGSVYLLRQDQYRAVSASLLLRTGAAVGAQVALAFLSATALSLMLGFTIGLAAQAAMLAALVFQRSDLRPPRVRNMRAMFLRFRRQVLVDLPSTVVSAVATNVITFGLALLYDRTVVGFYSIGSRLAVVPLTLFNDSLSQVFFQKAARAREEKGHIWDELKFSLLTSALLSVAVLVALVLFARPFVRVFLGPEWVPAADMLIVLAPMLAVRSMTMSVATTVFVLRSAHWLFVHNVATVVLPLLAFAGAALLQLSAIQVLSAISVLLTCEYVLFAWFLVHAARRDRARARS